MLERLLIFGGLGFIGANFVNWVSDNRPRWVIKIADAETYAADRSRLSTDPKEIRVVNLLQPEEYDDLVLWSDIVVNFAAETHNDNSLRNPEVFIETNILGTAKLLDLCVKLEKPLIQISTDEVYGDFDYHSTEMATEASPYRPSSPYSASKASADHLVRAWSRSFGVRAIVTHCTNNFGPGQHSEKFIPNILGRIERGAPIQIYGDGRNVRDWIHVDDHSSAIALLIESEPWGQTFNISANNELDNVSVVHRILELLGLPAYPVEFVTDRPGHDRRYGLDSSKIRSLGWAPSKSHSFADVLNPGSKR